eukprot:gb/GEZN01011739.1/.p1 GENE.gb/GEZN01011739.1/~~gb/GEZN01011739.1/.p1  ORF type:complete len:335 (-),score=26.17 gb/GEZN01011739.1/:102-1106(-)
MSSTDVVEGAPAFKNLLYKLSDKRLDAVHPRAKDRSEIMWRTAVTIRENDTLKMAFDKMAEHNILCLPVIGSLNNKVVGELHMGHLLGYIVDHFDVDPNLTTMGEFFTERQLLETTRVGTVYDDTKYHVCRDRYSVYHAAELMARNDAKRVIITNSKDRIRGIFTQSMLIGEVYSNLHLLNPWTKTMPVRMMTKSYWVSSIREDSRAIDAFRRMNDWGRTSLAVTDWAGSIVDELSEKDLKAVTATKESYMRLYSTVKECKAFVRHDTKTKGQKLANTPQLVTEDDTFEQVVTVMEKTPCHRVFVVDNMRDKIPQFVITQTDIIRQIFPSFGGW